MEYRVGSRWRGALRYGVPVLVVALGAGLVGAWAVGGGDDAAGAIRSAEPVTVPTTTTSTTTTSVEATTSTTTTSTTSTTTSSSSTTTVPPTTLFVTETLPEQPPTPVAPPPDPRGLEDQIQLGGIEIPKLGVSEPLLEGIRLTTLDNGPGHWPGTAMPGEVGNVVVAAHRTSHGAPFRHIDQLVAGDVVNFTTASGVSTYEVTGTEIVGPDALWIVDPTETPTATLFACHPPGSVAQRIVVYLDLLE